MNSKIVYLVSEVSNWDDKEIKIPTKAFESEEKAKEFAEEFTNQHVYSPQFDEDVWNEIELDLYNLTEDDPNYQNNEEFSYPNNVNKYYERQAEIEHLEFETYIELLKNRFPNLNEEEIIKRLIAHLDYLDHQYDDVSVCIDKIEYIYE